MVGADYLRARIAAFAALVRSLREFDWKPHLTRVGYRATRGVAAGLDARDLQAILRGDEPTEKPNPRYRAHDKSFLLHIRPKSYRRASTWFTHTWRLGWLATFFFIFETVTGLGLMVFYAPTPERAYGDIVRILSDVPFGQFVRDLHRLGAEAMVAVVVLHMGRVYFTGAYKGPRRFTWVTGVVLLLIVLCLSFSGYLLPWDQLAYWAVTVGTSLARSTPVVGERANLLLRGAAEIGQDGLMRFYLLHVVLLPLGGLFFVGIHYYKVAREHSISLPASVVEGDLTDREKSLAVEKVDLIPDLLLHEVMLASVVIFLLVLAVTTFFHAPLASPADSQITPTHTAAPWYFLWLQGLQKLGNAALAGIVIPTAILGVLLLLPWIDRNPYRLAGRRKIAVLNGVLLAAALVVLTYMGTPGYGIETPPVEAILEHYVPETHPGPVRELPWDELEAAPDGSRKTYFVSYPEGYPSDPAYSDSDRYEFIGGLDAPAVDSFHRLLLKLKADVETEARLIAPVDGEQPLAVVTVEEYQPNLKWVVVRITWDERLTVEATRENSLQRPNQQEAALAIHREAAYDH